MELKKISSIKTSVVLKKIFNENESKHWLSRVSTSISHDGQLFCFSYKTNLCIYENTQKTQEVYHFDKVCSLEGERITSNLWYSIPFQEETRKSLKELIIIGTSEGNVRFLTKRGKIIDEQSFYHAPVLKIKHNQDDILIVYSGAVVKLESKNLNPYLQKKLSETEEEENIEFPEIIWMMNVQEKINDAIMCKEGLQSLLDVYKSNPLDQAICVGIKPSICSFNNKEGSPTVISASKIATKVATKVSKAVFSLAKNLFFGGNEEEEEEPKKKKISPLPIVSSPNIHYKDYPREVRSILLDPSSHFAVTSDSLGRVMILDIQNMVIVKMFKGYRDAQCTWVLNNNNLFLSIYVPRRGLLEVWDIMSGMRHAQFNVGHECLLYQLPNSPLKKKDEKKPGDTLLLTPDGTIFKIVNDFEVFDSQDQQFFEKYKKLLNDKGSEEQLEEILKIYKSQKFLQMSIDLLIDYNISTQLKLTETALSVTKDEKFQRYFQSRIQILQVYQLVKNKVELEYEKNIWKEFINEEELESLKQIIISRDLVSKDVDYMKFLNCFDISGDRMRLRPNSISYASIVFNSIFNSYQLFEKVQYLLHLELSDIQELFVYFLFGTELKVLTCIDPNTIKKVTSTLEGSKKKIYSKISRYCKTSPNSPNSILILKLFKKEIEESERIYAKSKEIFFIQSRLTIDMAKDLSIATIEKDIPIYKLVAIQILSGEPAKINEIENRFECDDMDIIPFFSCLYCFEKSQYDKIQGYLSSMKSISNQTACIYQIWSKFVIENSKQFDYVYKNIFDMISKEFKTQIRFIRKVIKSLNQTIDLGDKIDYAEALYESRNEFIEKKLSGDTIDEIYLLISFLDIILTISKPPEFNLSLLFSSTTLGQIYSFKTESINSPNYKKDYLQLVLEKNYNQALELCEIFNISKDSIQIMYIKTQYSKFNDELADEVLMIIKDKFKASIEMIEIARYRLGLVIQYIGKDKKNLHLLSYVPVQLLQWVMNSKIENDNTQIDDTFLLKTKILLEKCVEITSSKKDSIEYKKSNQMLQFMKNIKLIQ